MNPLKAQIKMAFLQEQGEQFDDLLEGKERTQHELAGAVMALKQAHERITPGILAAVAADLDSGVFATLHEPLEIRAYVVKQLTRVTLALENMQFNVEREKILAEGRAAQLREIVAATKKALDKEAADLAAHSAAVAAGQEDTSGRPAMSAAEDIAQRRADAAKLKQTAVKPTPGKRQARTKKPQG